MKISLFFGPLHILLVSHLIPVVESLCHFDCSVISILLNPINFYRFTIFFIHFCYVKLSLSVNQLKVTWLRIQLGALQHGAYRFLPSLLRSLGFLIWFLFCLWVSTVGEFLVLFVLSFHVGLGLLLLVAFDTLFFAFLIGFWLVEVLHLPMEILEEAFSRDILSVIICSLLDKTVVGFWDIFELLLAFRTWVIFRMVFQGTCPVGFLDLVDVSIFINAQYLVGIKLPSHLLWEVLLEEGLFLGF